LVELAASRLSREILSGGVDPGERLVEEQLTRRFGISRAPLREAMRLLAQQGHRAEPREDHAQYIKSWINVLKAD
jgi:DNA-binding GntR family transcriptional regulator